MHRPAGTYFATADIRPLGFDDGIEFCRSLPERCGVVAVPSAVFYERPGTRPPSRPLRVLQAGRGPRRGPLPDGGAGLSPVGVKSVLDDGAAVDVPRLAGDPRALVGAQVHDGVGDVVAGAGPAERDARR